MWLGRKADQSTPTRALDQENMDLYIHSRAILRGLVLKYLSTRTTLPYNVVGIQNKYN
jgi:hypothetical protein